MMDGVWGIPMPYKRFLEWIYENNIARVKWYSIERDFALLKLVNGAFVQNFL